MESRTNAMFGQCFMLLAIEITHNLHACQPCQLAPSLESSAYCAVPLHVREPSCSGRCRGRKLPHSRHHLPIGPSTANILGRAGPSGARAPEGVVMHGGFSEAAGIQALSPSQRQRYVNQRFA